MPKIIENLQARLVEEARKQIEEAGYSAMTIRSVAKGCGVGVGTVYNYFPSKDALVAAYMLQDWQECMIRLHAVSESADGPLPVLEAIYQLLIDYARRHRVLFQDESAAASFSGSFSHYHGLLRKQLADPIRKFCQEDFSADFIAESLLTWTMAGRSFGEIYGMICKLF